ncbi:claudin-5-like [Scleropages formosus]|uniref:Claudin n=1 Tax=Scleropages formosus TaxID=113540 RepID=A0A0P7WSB2_SCLFO|nr:claudin-4-like [Scleropages formosus]KPP66512.1 claudin-5-like [Scleropages formosus]
MISGCLEILGLALSVAGTLLAMVACGLPMWKVSAHIDSNIVVAQTIWEGLWMTCVTQSTGQIQCKLYDSVLSLSAELQTARALTVVAAVTGVLGLALAVAGAQCTNCIRREALKARVVNAGGAAYVLSAVLVMVPLSWVAHGIISDFRSADVRASSKREIGASIYVGWAAAALLLAGGALLCCSCPPPAASASYPVKCPPASGKSVALNGEYGKKNYV